MARGKFVAYYRVSTARQGRSGLGLEAQQRAVAEYLNGGAWELVAEFTETESGKRTKNRPQLVAALATCKKHEATLIIAKLDRLSRNVAFIANLMESKVAFRAVDMPDANNLTLHIMAAIAEHEAKVISERTRAALAAVKLQEKKGPRKKAGKTLKPLGWNGKKLAKANRSTADTFARELAPTVRRLQQIHPTVRDLASALNAAAIKTARGGRWHVASVHRLLQRIGAE